MNTSTPTAPKPSDSYRLSGHDVTLTWTRTSTGSAGMLHMLLVAAQERA